MGEVIELRTRQRVSTVERLAVVIFDGKYPQGGKLRQQKQAAIKGVESVHLVAWGIDNPFIARTLAVNPMVAAVITSRHWQEAETSEARRGGDLLIETAEQHGLPIALFDDYIESQPWADRHGWECLPTDPTAIPEAVSQWLVRLALA